MEDEIAKETLLQKEVERLEAENKLLRKIIQTKNHTIARMIDHFILSQNSKTSQKS